MEKEQAEGRGERKSKFFVGVLLGFYLGVGTSFVFILYCGWTGLLTPESRVLQTTVEWARISEVPEDAVRLKVKVRGSPFSRTHIVSFRGELQDIENWIESCPGINDPDCKILNLDDGRIEYHIPPGGGAQGAILTHDPEAGEVVIYSYWS